jgi:hypothetical protein
MSDNKEDCRPDHVAAASYPKGGGAKQTGGGGVKEVRTASD